MKETKNNNIIFSVCIGDEYRQKSICICCVCVCVCVYVYIYIYMYIYRMHLFSAHSANGVSFVFEFAAL